VPPDNPGARPELSAAAPGLNGYVFRTQDADALYRRLAKEAVAVEPPGEFSRPVDIDGERRDAKFRTVRLQAREFPAGRVYFCRHLTPELVWRTEWQAHANGATGIVAAVWVVQDPGYYVSALTRLVGRGVRADASPVTFAVGGTTIELFDYAQFVERYGSLAIGVDERTDFMACVRIRTRSLDVARDCLAAHRVAFDAARPGSIVVPSAEAFNVVIEFCE